MKKINAIRPTGLKGNQELDRIRQLMGTFVNESRGNSVVELTKVGPNGVVYGIVRENHEYYIKTTDKKSDLIAEDFNYIGGLQNKKSEVYPSYAKAIKQLNLKFLSLNETFGGEKINVFENDRLLREDHATAGGSMGFVEEVEDMNGDTAPEDKDTSGDNLEGDFKEKPKASSTNTGKPRGAGHDTEIIKEDEVELTEDEEAIDKMITGESLDAVGKEDSDVDNDGDSDDSDDYLVNKRLKIGKAISIGESEDKLSKMIKGLSPQEIKALSEALKKKL